MGEVGLEPTKPLGKGFTAPRNCRYATLPVWKNIKYDFFIIYKYYIKNFLKSQKFSQYIREFYTNNFLIYDIRERYLDSLARNDHTREEPKIYSKK